MGARRSFRPGKTGAQSGRFPRKAAPAAPEDNESTEVTGERMADGVQETGSSSSSSSRHAHGGASSSSHDVEDMRNADTLDAAFAACEEGGSVASSKQQSRVRACDDQSIAPPKPSRADWEAEMEKTRKLAKDAAVSDEEKIRVLNEALMQRIEDIRLQEESKALSLKRLEDVSKEQERHRLEISPTAALKLKLEASCREQQQQMVSLSKENQTIAQEERSRHNELKDKFQQAIKDVQEKMDAELEVRQHFLRENDDLRSKLQRFNETYEAQEAQLAEQREARNKEMEVVQERLREHETMCACSKANALQLEKENEVLRKSQTVLRDELQSILAKFDEFSKAVTGSNKRHGECKEEIDALQSEMAEHENENASLKENARLTQLLSEQQVAQKQVDALDKLCENLRKENRKLQEQIEFKKGKA